MITHKQAADLGRNIGMTIKWNSEWQEFYVYPKGTGKDHPSAYFTNDVEDAVYTAHAMAGVEPPEDIGEPRQSAMDCPGGLG